MLSQDLSVELLKASEGLSETVQKQLEVEVESIDRRITSIRNYVDDSMESRLTSMRTFLKSTVKLFDDKLSTISSVMDGPSPAMTMRSSIANRAAPQESEERSQRFEDIEKRLRKMESDTSVSSVKFASLGFESAQDSNAWLLTHAPSHPIGLIIDPFIVMHHISINIYGRDGLHAMELARKLKLQNLDASVSVSSFECGIPRILCKEGVSTAKLITESCFTRIPNFKTWDERGTGVRALVKEQLVEPVPLLKPKRSDIQIVLNVGSVFPRFALKRKLMKCLTTNHLWMKPHNSVLSNEEMTTAGFFSKLCCDDVLRVSLAHEINVLLKAERLKQGKKFDSKFQIPAHHVLRVSVTNRVVYSRSNEAQAEAIVLECPKRMLNGVISLLPRVTQQLSCQNTTINEIVFISAKLPYSKEVSNAAAIYDAAIVEQSRYCECHTNFRIGGISSDVMNNSFRETIFEACDSIHGIYPTMLTSSEGVWIVSTTISCVDQAHQWCDDNLCDVFYLTVDSGQHALFPNYHDPSRIVSSPLHAHGDSSYLKYLKSLLPSVPFTAQDPPKTDTHFSNVPSPGNSYATVAQQSHVNTLPATSPSIDSSLLHQMSTLQAKVTEQQSVLERQDCLVLTLRSQLEELQAKFTMYMNSKQNDDAPNPDGAPVTPTKEPTAVLRAPDPEDVFDNQLIPSADDIAPVVLFDSTDDVPPASDKLDMTAKNDAWTTVESKSSKKHGLVAKSAVHQSLQQSKRKRSPKKKSAVAKSSEVLMTISTPVDSVLDKVVPGLDQPARQLDGSTSPDHEERCDPVMILRLQSQLNAFVLLRRTGLNLGS